MRQYNRIGFSLVFLQLASLLLLRTDHALSFGVGGLPTSKFDEGASQMKTSNTFVRSRVTGNIPTLSYQPLNQKSNIRQNISGTRRNMNIVGVSPEPIHTAFSFATFGPQPFWLLMILLPTQDVTKKIMGKMDVVIFFALVHFFIVSASIAQPGATAPLLEFNDVFDPGKDSQAAFMNMVTNYPNFVAEEWPHVLTWDLFVGRYIWLDGLKRGVFTSHSVLFANLIGPPGLLLHWATCLVTGKGFGGTNEALDEE